MAGGINSIGNLLGKVNANNALVVTLDGGAAAATEMTLTQTGLGTTTDEGLIVINTTDAAAGAQQVSPAITLQGEGWKTDATAASQTVAFRIHVLPVQGTSAPSGNYLLQASINGGAYSTVLTVSSAGVVTSTNDILSAADVRAGAASSLYWTGSSKLKAPSDGVIRLSNDAQTDFSRLQFGGTTSSFPALKRSSADLQARVGDDTAYTNIDALRYKTSAGLVGFDRTAYGAGTAYALTNTAAAIDLGTTDPAIVLSVAGTYLIFGQVNLAYNGATVTTETATIKVRRTNNTAADLSAVVVLDLPVATTLTHTYGVFQIPPFLYTTAATDDAVTLFANVSATLGAGSIDATAIGTSIVAVRLY